MLQDQQNPTLAWIVDLCAVLVIALHLLAARQEATSGHALTLTAEGPREVVCDVADIRDGTARIARLSTGERVAVFFHDGTLSALSNACAHQNRPLGEGKVLNCLVTCPWHGFQYNLTDGRSPAPFKEMVPTYLLRIVDGAVLVNTRTNPPGTHVDPGRISRGA